MNQKTSKFTLTPSTQKLKTTDKLTKISTKLKQKKN